MNIQNVLKAIEDCITKLNSLKTIGAERIALQNKLSENLQLFSKYFNFNN